MKKVVVIGASPNLSRYSFVAVKMLIKSGFQVIPIGIRKGSIQELPIILGKPELEDVHTVSVFISREKQKEYDSYILGLKPSRIILNPGAENPNFERKAKRRGIEVIRACTIEMISARKF